MHAIITPFTMPDRNLELNLPDKLSDLIEVAIGDLKSVVADGHQINMSDVWLQRINGHCAVCLAGACMLQKTNPEILRRCPAKHFFQPDNYTFEVREKLYALDNARNGRWRTALMRVLTLMTGNVLASDFLTSDTGVDLRNELAMYRWRDHPHGLRTTEENCAAMLESVVILRRYGQ